MLHVEVTLSADIPPHLLHDDNIAISIAHPQNTEVQNTEGQNEKCIRRDILINRKIDIAVYINNNGGGDYKDEE